MENNNPKKKKRIHFGVLMSTIDDPIQCEIWDGIVKFAEVHDIHLTAYIGSHLTADDVYTSHYETCFMALEKNEDLDGVILFSGSIAHYINPELVAEAVSRFREDLPVISVSYAIPGIPTVLADNIAGIFSAVDHLIKVHNKKQIAFVMGPAGHPEAEERLEGYKNALAANNLEFDERYVLPGNFSEEGGFRAIEELIDVRGIPYDAVAASDDSTAMGVMHELKNRGIYVPADVAVTGFDGVREAETFIPSISTVHQNFTEIGIVSAESLLRRVNGLPVDDVINVTPTLLARQSCGCLENDFINRYINYDDDPIKEDSLMSFISGEFAYIFSGEAPKDVVLEWVKTLVEKTVEDPFDKSGYLTTLDEILIGYTRFSKDYSKWHEAMSVMTMGVEIYNTEVNCIHTVLSTLIRGITLVHDICIRNEKNIEFSLSDFQLELRRIASTIVSIFDIDALNEVLHKSLPMLSINSAIIGLYRDHIIANATNNERKIEKVIGFDNDTIFSIESQDLEPILYSDYSPIEAYDFEAERRTLFFFPLFFETEEMGILLFPYNNNIKIDVYETIRVNISTAIRGAELIHKIRALSVTDELTGLYNRRGFFQLTASKLQFLSRNPESIPALLIMDMDGLKHINDNLGHKEGDAALSAFAQILKQTLRKGDIIGRLGGDEFVVLSSVKNEQDGDYLVKRIRENIDEYNKKGLHPYSISTCIGCVVLEEATKECFEAAMLSADDVLYEEKAEKRAKGIARK